MAREKFLEDLDKKMVSFRITSKQKKMLVELAANNMRSQSQQFAYLIEKAYHAKK